MSDDIKSAVNNATKNKIATAAAQQKTWLGLLWLFAIVSVISLVLLVIFLNRVSDYVSSVNQLEVYSSRIVNNVNDATFSHDYNLSSAAYESLPNDIQQYEQALRQARTNAIDNHAVFATLSSEWQEVKPKAEYVLKNQNSVNAFQDSQQQVNEGIQSLQSNYITATKQAVDAGLPADQIVSFQEQMVRAEKVGEAFDELISSADANPEDFNNLNQQFAQTLTSQQRTMATQVPALQQVERIYNEMIAPISENLANASTPTIESREQARALSNLAVQTQQQLASVDRNILMRPRILIPTAGFLFGLLGALFAMYKRNKIRATTERLLLEKETLRQRQDMEVESERAQRIQEENERNQMAILRLLDELGDLAEGDLTVNATVSEDFTGAIADSVNFAIDQLRQLVLAINTTAVRVAQSSEQTQMTAVELAEASEHQAQEIAGVSAAINEMAVSIDQVSANAAESTSVAQRSVAIAHNGAEVVQRSIEGMNTIREQIQETSKRIKRLGESSQEIGDIIGLINDIADQTNVLALNAAIQASMAGEAGRGFAVVADEVQRLAERSANATKQIETLVKTIQADTNEAVMSMETTTTEVVRGARLAKDAGEALEEVQNVSHTLADLIQNISNAAQQQASSAGHISKTMNIIQDITSQTSSGTMATARSVGQLNEMAAALQESVSGFKLNEDDVLDEVLLEDL